MRYVAIQRRDQAGKYTLGDVRKADIKDIVIHRNTVADRLDGVATFFRVNPSYKTRLFPYHFFIDDGVIYQVHPLSVVSPHARGRNQTGIGIALNVDGRRERPNWEKFMRPLSALVWRLTRGGARVVPHSEEKRCPGELVDMEWLRGVARMTTWPDQAEVWPHD